MIKRLVNVKDIDLSKVDDKTDDRIRQYAFKHKLPYIVAANHVLNNRTLQFYGGAS